MTDKLIIHGLPDGWKLYRKGPGYSYVDGKWVEGCGYGDQMTSRQDDFKRADNQPGPGFGGPEWKTATGEWSVGMKNAEPQYVLISKDGINKMYKREAGPFGPLIYVAEYMPEGELPKLEITGSAHRAHEMAQMILYSGWTVIETPVGMNVSFSVSLPHGIKASQINPDELLAAIDKFLKEKLTT